MNIGNVTLGFVLALLVLICCVVLAVVQGPTATLALIGALALARLVP